MQSNTKHKLAAGAAALAAAAGTGGAVAATQAPTRSPRGAFVQDLAQRLNVSPQRLDSAMQAAYFDRLDAAVAAGKLSRTRADHIEQRVRQQGAMPWLQAGAGHHGHHGHGGRVRVAANYLGLTRAALIAQLRSGKSLAQVARAQGRPVSGLKAALLSAARTRLARSVADGRITAAREQELLTKLPSRLDRLVNRPGLGQAGHHG